jgi:hypothetical protein
MTGGARPSVSAGGSGALAGRAGPNARVGCARAAGKETCCARLGLKKKGEGWREKRKPFKFQKPLKQMNSNKSLNSNTQNNVPACMQQGIPIFHY